MNHLDQLESESVYILREAFNRIEKLAMLWSLGKDSNTMVWLAKKAFFGHVPFPVVHVDTGKKFAEMYAVPHPLRGRVGPEPDRARSARRSSRSTRRCRLRRARRRARPSA